jgi:hypothetical protein
MFKEIPKSDIVTRPFKVYKEWIIDEQDTDISILYGVSSSFGAFDPDTDDLSGVIYRSIQAQFYRDSTNASILTEVGRRKSYASNDERNLESEFGLISIPQHKYGEGIKVGTVKFTDNNNDKVYLDDGYSNLVSGSTICGNIMYDRGFVILTKDTPSGSLTDFRIEYNSTQTIYENEIFIPVLENEFNVSQNPTSLVNVDYDSGSVIIKNQNPERSWGGGIATTINSYTQSYTSLRSAKINPLFNEYDVSASIDPTGSYLAPFITTIGLYDNELNMVAVAKLARPMKSLPDYPLNFIIRFDT